MMEPLVYVSCITTPLSSRTNSKPFLANIISSADEVEYSKKVCRAPHSVWDDIGVVLSCALWLQLYHKFFWPIDGCWFMHGMILASLNFSWYYSLRHINETRFQHIFLCLRAVFLLTFTLRFVLTISKFESMIKTVTELALLVVFD